ncbi:molybdate ABC transporter substrate-binding protein [Paractinoplanes hotanensis]|uniref:Molybdate ABC transporter substrate-binding protein n=1 Tax=Paractinoplanes hotanensis TaxID=2906497 RepID=A0ABT0XXH4_9ACTN|nr:molybdate ABC transporter substrate-binding protein [Actinoplanes hotanensis]MCM4078449.1 molybdate ABC transporter substrate-binding protein [Actinoplanes hotanensis]
MRVLAGLAILAVLATAGCGGANDGGRPAEGGGSAEPGATGSLTVLAAASLTEAFDKIKEDFQERNPSVQIVISYGGSSGLAQQITSGAPADVFAAASPATMKTVVDAGDADGEPTVFVRNQLVIATAEGNPKGIATLADLTNPDLKVALCAEQVPCGSAAKTAIEAAGVDITPVTLEQDVRAALSKVKLGEVDAALVYRTDAEAAAADVDGVEFPESAGAINDYPIVTLKNAPNPSAAAAFVAFVRSEPELRILTDAGFQKP